MYIELAILLIVVLVFEFWTAPNSGKVKSMRADVHKVSQSKKV